MLKTSAVSVMVPALLDERSSAPSSKYASGTPMGPTSPRTTTRSSNVGVAEPLAPPIRAGTAMDRPSSAIDMSTSTAGLEGPGDAFLQVTRSNDVVRTGETSFASLAHMVEGPSRLAPGADQPPGLERLAAGAALRLVPGDTIGTEMPLRLHGEPADGAGREPLRASGGGRIGGRVPAELRAGRGPPG